MKSHVDAIMLFVAELTGTFVAGSGNRETKIECGRQAYITNTFHDLDLTDEEDCKDLHENIWLERLYKELDDYFKIEPIRSLRALSLAAEVYRTTEYRWTVPIELDATSSMAQIISVLLNDKRLMNMTNVIGDTLEDAWKIEGLPRSMVKKAMTPILYASSKTCSELWQSSKLKFNLKHIEIFNNEIAKGAFGLCSDFKDFIINNCKPKSEMEIVIGSEVFSIKCNRFRNVGDKTKAYKIWDSVDETYNTILHTDTVKVPDLEQFRTFFMTLFIHNLDSQIMDAVALKAMEKYGWAIDIHDAIVCSPAAAEDIRMWYCMELEAIHANRKTILANFFKSIGITAASSEQWELVKSKVVPLEEKFKANSMALK